MKKNAVLSFFRGKGRYKECGINLKFLDASSHLYKRVCPSVGPSVGPSVRPSVTRYFLMMRKWPKWCNRLENVLVTLCDASLGNSRQLWATLGQLRDASMGQLLALLVGRSVGPVCKNGIL